jgi:hypothetical protein
MDWRIKAAAQAAFAILPFGERLNHVAQRLNGSHSVSSQVDAFGRQRLKLAELIRRFPIAGKTVMEIGTGWNGIGILLFALEGAAEIHSFDHVAHLRLPVMRQLLKVIASDERYRSRAERLLEAQTLPDLLKLANAHYHAPADAASTGLPDRSIDLVYSYGVLEHIPPAALERITAESKRILRGRAFHRIGVNDHFQGVDPTIGAANFLQFTSRQWWWINNRINYQNRLRPQHYAEMFARHGGRLVYRHDELIPRDIAKLNAITVRTHADLPSEELATSQVDVDVVFA